MTAAPKSEREAIALCEPQIEKLARRFMSCGAALDDLVQAGRCGAASAWRSWDPKGAATFKTWAHLPIHWAIWQAAKREADHRDRIRYCETVEHESPEDEHVDLFALARLKQAFDALPSRFRFVVSALYYEGRTYGAVASDLGVTRQRIQQLEREALKHMRAKINRGASYV